MKRNKHILINLTDAEYNEIIYIANANKRKIADVAYLLLLNSLDKDILQYIDRGGSSFEKLKFNN